MEVTIPEVVPKYDFSDSVVLSRELDENINGSYSSNFKTFLRDETNKMLLNYVPVDDPDLRDAFIQHFFSFKDIVRNALEQIWFDQSDDREIEEIKGKFQKLEEMKTKTESMLEVLKQDNSALKESLKPIFFSMELVAEKFQTTILARIDRRKKILTTNVWRHDSQFVELGQDFGGAIAGKLRLLIIRRQRQANDEGIVYLNELGSLLSKNTEIRKFLVANVWLLFKKYSADSESALANPGSNLAETGSTGVGHSTDSMLK